MKRVYLILAGLSVIWGQALGQFPNALDNLKNVMPPSPNSSAFAQYGNWPVSLYTGVPNISIPVTTLKGRTTSVPISLSYHASGNHVGDIASWVGLGWSLNAGGVISRTVRGLNDDATLFGDFHYTNPNDLSTSTSSDVNDQRTVMTAKNTMDSEQDTYNFTALGKSYRLLLLADGTVKTTPSSNLKFVSNPIAGSATAAGNDTWTVIMEDGTKLLFGGNAFTERTSNPNFSTGGDGKGISYTSSWHLQSITSTTGELITFQYSSSNIEQDSYFSQTDNIQYKMDTVGSMDPTNMCSLFSQSLETNSRASIQYVNALNVSSIRSDLMTVKFITTGNRQDLYGGVVLSEVKVFSNITSRLIEDYVFNTSYSQAISSNEYIGTETINSSYFYKRLRLNSFQKKDTLNPGSPQTWTFAYNPQNLPSRRSFAQDHWGYYNGMTNNTSILPKIYFALPPNDPRFDGIRQNFGFMPGMHDLGGNRFGNANYMQAEMLTQITYPTGGYSQFNYEANSVPTTKETFKDVSFNLQLHLTSSSGPTENIVSGTFTITTPAYIGINLTTQISPSVLRDQPGANVSCMLYDQNNNLVGGTRADGIYYYNIMSAGTYTAKVIANTVALNLSSGDYLNGFATISYPSSAGVHSFNLLTGGLRVKSIIDYDGVTTNGIDAKYYQYANPLVIAPVDTVNAYVTKQVSSFYNYQYTDVAGYVVTQCFFLNTIRNSSSKFSFGSTAGGTTGYGKVTTLFGLNGANGTTVSTFNSEPDFSTWINGTVQFPFAPADSRDHRRGLLLSEQTYNNQNVLIKGLDNTYSFNQVGQMKCFKAGYKSVLSMQYCGNMYGNCGIVQRFYTVTAEQVKHLTSTQTVFDVNGLNPVITKTTYYYDNPSNTQPIRTVTYNSKGDTITTYSRTALEKTDINNFSTLSGPASSAIDSMVRRNMVGQVIQNVRYNNSLLEVAETTNYNQWTNLNNIILPQNEVLQYAYNTPFTKVTVNSYDAKGNPLQVTPLNGVTENYIWDYLSSHAVAEIKNAGSNAFAYTSFESDGLGNWSISSSSTDNTTGFTGTKSFVLTSKTLSLSGLNSTMSYTVSLWGKGATVNINGTAVTGGDTRKGWTLFQKTITGATSITISGSGNIDEVRLVPAGAQMTTYAYSDFGPTSITDAANATTFYEYDGMGRLATIRDDKNKVLKTFRYNYKTNP